MISLHKTQRQFFEVSQAAHMLSISVDELYRILDQHVFNPENPRPSVLELTYNDIVLLSVWARPERGANVLEMPRRARRE
jgi:hypothetical protein